MRRTRYFGVLAALVVPLGCAGSSSGTPSSDGGVDTGASDGQVNRTTEGGSEDGGACAWTGTWSTRATPANFTSGDCTAAPPLPELVIGSDGSLSIAADASVTPCQAVMPSVSTCQTFGFCLPWDITLNFQACDQSTPCMGGLASQLSHQGDGGPCSVAFTLTRVGP